MLWIQEGQKDWSDFPCCKATEETDGSAGNNLSSVELYPQPEQFDKMIHCVLNLQIQTV